MNRSEEGIVTAVAHYIEAKCERDECPLWMVHQRVPVYDAGCALGLIDDGGCADNTRHSFSECLVVQRLLDM